jgi:hypothetical protein
MRLQWQRLSMQGEKDTAYETPVIDSETGKKVGFVHFEVTPVFRLVSLFDDKYQGEFKTNSECDAFIRGVEAVLNHVVSVADDADPPRQTADTGPIEPTDSNAISDEAALPEMPAKAAKDYDGSPT